MIDLTHKIYHVRGLETRCKSIHNDFPDKNSDKLLIIGSADNYMDDVEKVGGLNGYDVMAVNLMINELDPILIDHHVSPHPDITMLGNHNITRHALSTSDPEIGIDYFWYFNPGFCSGGGFAAWIGQAMGYKLTIMCGCPLDSKYEKFLHGFESRKHLFPRVRSVSGNTKKILGDICQ